MVDIADRQLLIATSNPGKVTEIRAALIDLPLVLYSLQEFPGLATPDENGRSYSENAIIKATSYAGQTGIHALADDSGLEVQALGGGPGLKSARFGGVGITNDERIALLLSDLASTTDQERRARFVCVMVIADPSTTLCVEHGVCEGRIATAPAGSGGFGYDSIFIPDGHQLTFGQLSADVKNDISHRAKALQEIRQFLAGLDMQIGNTFTRDEVLSMGNGER